jgi:hypothetical protein
MFLLRNTSQAVVERAASSNNKVDQYSTCDVVIPKNGGCKEISYTEGFRRYTQLVNKVCDEYTQLSPKLKRQFVIDNIITPLLNEQRDFYRYDRKKKVYVMVDLSDETKLNYFASNVVMQKIRDVTKSSTSDEIIETNAHVPTVKVKPKGCDVVIPKNGGGKECSHTEGFQRYTRLVNEVCDEYTNLPGHQKRQFVINNVIIPLLDAHRNFYRYDSKKKGYFMVDLSDDTKLNDFTTNVVMQKIRDIMKPSSKEIICKRKQKECDPTVKPKPKKQRATSYDKDSCSTATITKPSSKGMTSKRKQKERGPSMIPKPKKQRATSYDKEKSNTAIISRNPCTVTTTTDYEEQEDIDNFTINLVAFDEDDHSLATTFSVNETVENSVIHIDKNLDLIPLNSTLSSNTDTQQFITSSVVETNCNSKLFDFSQDPLPADQFSTNPSTYIDENCLSQANGSICEEDEKILVGMIDPNLKVESSSINSSYDPSVVENSLMLAEFQRDLEDTDCNLSQSENHSFVEL